MDAVVEFLLKYRSAAFANGTLAFDPVLPVWVVLLVAFAAAAVALWTLSRLPGRLSRTTRPVLGGLRLMTVALLAWCLCRPVLVVAEALSQRNVVAVLLDDSRSMRIADVDGNPRATTIRALAGGPDSSLLRALAARYQVRVYRTSASGRAPAVSALAFDGSRTRLLGAITRVEDELVGTPLSGVVVLSDGAENGGVGEGAPSLADQLATVRARGVPVYTVGIGSTRFAKDIEISEVGGPRQALRNATVLLDVVITHRGFGGESLPVVVEDSGRIVASATVRLSRDAESTPVRLRVPTPDAGARLLAVRVPVQPGELVPENNARRALLTVRDRREKVLYLEGEPRPELKFARRAVDGDRQLQLVTLLRSAKDKYLRLGVDDSLELVNGFPTTRAQLFAYRAIVLGSIEASFFTGDQLRMLADFVGERGGGLLLLGGRESFADGGYVGTALSDLMPVDMEVSTRSEDDRLVAVTAVPTAAGLRHPALQVAGSDSLVANRWRTLPPLTTVNLLARAKPGASVLLQGRSGERGLTRPLLVSQRYGRGRVLALGAQDDWLWQMHADIAVDDSTHERLWRQMLRWLVNDVPDRVEVVTDEESGSGDAVPLRAIVRDSGYLRRNGVAVTALVAGPAGASQDVPFEWAVDRDGEYAGSFIPAADGVQEVRVRAIAGGDTVTSAPAFVRVAEPVEEYFGAERRDVLLEQLARETGGRSYTPQRAAEIARDLAYSASGATAVRRLDLWDAPLVLLLLLALLGGEWALRRARGLT
ncbi:MAG: glutamine amidotransferase [Gemmatimonadota bacterium]